MASFFDSNIVISSDDPMLKVYIDSLQENNKSLQQDIEALETYIDGLENTLQTLNNTDLLERIDQLEKKLLKASNENKQMEKDYNMLINNNENINKIQKLESKLLKVISQKDKMEHDCRLLMDQAEETNKKDTEHYINIIKELQEAKNKLHNICENNTYSFSAITDEIDYVANSFTVDNLVAVIANIADLSSQNSSLVQDKIQEYYDQKSAIKNVQDLKDFLLKYDSAYKNVVNCLDSNLTTTISHILSRIQDRLSTHCKSDDVDKTKIMAILNEFVNDHQNYVFGDETKCDMLMWVYNDVFFNSGTKEYFNNFNEYFSSLIRLCQCTFTNYTILDNKGDLFTDSSDDFSFSDDSIDDSVEENLIEDHIVEEKNQLKEENKELKQQLEKLGMNNYSLQDENKELRKENSDLYSALADLDDENVQLQSDIEALKNKKQSNVAYDALQEQFNTLQKQFNMLSKHYDDVTRRLADETTKNSACNKELIETRNKLSNIIVEYENRISSIRNNYISGIFL